MKTITKIIMLSAALATLTTSAAAIIPTSTPLTTTGTTNTPAAATNIPSTPTPPAATTGAATTTDSNQTVLLEKIAQGNASLETLTAHFNQTRTIPANGKKILYEGTLYFTSPNQMSMDYTSPETEVFIINGSDLYMVRDGKAGLYNTEKNAIMRSLSNTLCSCIMGKVNALAEANDADVELVIASEGYLVTLTARKKATRGYSTIILLYDKDTYVLTRMVLIEFSGISNLYEMSSISRNTAIDSAVYTIPQ